MLYHGYHLDFQKISYLCMLSRAVDDIEETELLARKKIYYQFSAKGHEMAQVILGSLLTHPRDCLNGYHRSRPMLFTLGLSLEDALAASLGKSGGINDGRDVGVVFNLLPTNGATVLPAAGGVGSQYTPTVGWAQAILYYRNVLGKDDYCNAIAVVHGGDGSVATGGFWSALNMATTLDLPMLFYIEDNGYAISVPGDLQTPGGNIAANLGSFNNLFVQEGDGTNPEQAAMLIAKAVDFVRNEGKPALLRLRVPRLSGHVGQDTQAYKSKEVIAAEKRRDPLPKLHDYVVPRILTQQQWEELQKKAKQKVKIALEDALTRQVPDPKKVYRYVFTEYDSKGEPELQHVGGLIADGHSFPRITTQPEPETRAISMAIAIRRTIAHELETNPKFVVFGEDVAKKGGLYGVTRGLQDKYGSQRVFDTSLSEEGIVGRAIGMALGGLLPLAEITFRRFADLATEQIHNCGTIRWRTVNKFAAPIIIRTGVGYLDCGNPWHSACDESVWTHAVGWQLVFPSNSEDAVGLLRAALRSNNPTIFIEHRALLYDKCAGNSYPGDSFVVPFGQARKVQTGDELTIITWGAMVEPCRQASKKSGISTDIIDLRSLIPWDRQMVLSSIKSTHKVLIVHEDRLESGFGAEISAIISEQAFHDLTAPIKRLAVKSIPIPFNVDLMNAVIPCVDDIADAMNELRNDDP